MAQDNKLADLAMGTGTLERARKILTSRAYQLHVQEAKANGQTPMSPEQWAKENGK
jgi:hypothetical protein